MYPRLECRAKIRALFVCLFNNRTGYTDLLCRYTPEWYKRYDNNK